MIKLQKPEDNDDETNLEEVGLEMVELIGLSFFDDKIVSRKVFQKSIKNAFDHEHILLNKFPMLTKSKFSNKEYRKKFFVLTESGFYKIKEEKNTIHYDYMPFEKTRIVIIDNPDLTNGSSLPYGFHLFRTQNTYKMCTEDKVLFEEIRNFLIYKTIMHTFHEEFDVQKLIGKGSFAKVILCS